MKTIMDLESETPYLDSLMNAEKALGEHSFTNYSSTRDILGDEKYPYTTDRYSSLGARDLATTTTKSSDFAITTTTSNSYSYRPSTLTTSVGHIIGAHPDSLFKTITSSASNANANANATLGSGLLSSATTAPLAATSNLYSSNSAAIDKLISSSATHSGGLKDTTNKPLYLSSNLTTGGVTGLLPATSGQTSYNKSISGLQHVTSANQIGAGSASRGLQSGLSQNLLQQLYDMRQIEDTVDSIEIPARGRCKVYMAKYGYDPFKQSPNDNPDAELALNAGDYVMVFDDIDEDGYFIGELMDGRRGYVPSNWLDRLTGEDLFEFQATTLYKQPKDDETESASYPPEFYDAIVSDTMKHSNFQHVIAPEDYHRMNDYVDLDDVNEVDDECLSDYERAEAEQMRRAVPPPQRLVLERQLNKSILIGWLHPQAAKGTIVSYQVYVDGVLKSTVPSGDRTKALLEGVDSYIPHRISVRAIDINGRHSNDAGCTIVIGQKVPFSPSCVKASHITSDSALISWLPCNSNFHHVVAVNSVEVQTVRPGVYKHLINGLSANTLYRVWVRAKPGKILSIDEKNPKKLESLTTYVDFKTMPKSLPDPPVNVQVEAGPQRRTLLVTWLPLTLNDFGSSNGCAVTGYAVFAGHKKLADIDSPTGDHALLDVTELESLHKKAVTVRTKSGENLSQDSMPCQIPDEYLKAASNTKNLNDHQSQHVRHGVLQQHHQRLSDTNQQTGHHISHRNHQKSLILSHNQHQQPHHQMHHRQQAGGRYSIGRGRQMTRSLQNLESDLDSRRSSIPAIEITRETSGSDFVNPTESYSEEEFESSMRLRGVRGKSGAASGVRGTARYRARQSHSVDSSIPHLNRYQSANLSRSRGTPIDRDIRFFVALYDYDPSTMSPNPNAASEELTFKEGSIIKVIGDKGADGFYKGELDNHVGFVPSNVIEEITDPNVLYSLHESLNASLNPRMTQAPGNMQQQQQQQHHHHQANQSLNQQQRNTMLNVHQELDPQQQQQQQHQQQQQPHQQQQQQQQPQQPVQGGVKRMTALYDYDPQENSPNADTESEIPFRFGDVIYVYGKMDTDGFYLGEVERTKQRGLVPSNFLREDPLPIKQGGPMPQQFNQATGGQMMTNPLDLFQQQQQRPLNPNQQMDQSMAYGQQKQQQLNKLNNPQMRGNIRGVLPPSQNQMASQNPQQNINRPTTLSLGSQNAQMMGVNQGDWSQQQRQALIGQSGMQGAGVVGMQQQQQQHEQGNSYGNFMNPQMGVVNQYGANQSGAGMMPGQQNQQQQYQQPLMQQQQAGINNQQPGAGGVLSNLLSSGKQIIGAATTPRTNFAPNQTGPFPPSMANQMGNFGGVGGAMNSGISHQTSNTLVGGPSVGLSDGTGSNFGSAQPIRANMMPQTNNFTAGDPSQQPHNSFNMTGNTNQMMQHHPQQQQQQQQQQQHPQHQQAQHNNQIMGGLGRPGPMSGAGQLGEEQGGTILNTVKNMFKL